MVIGTFFLSLTDVKQQTEVLLTFSKLFIPQVSVFSALKLIALNCHLYFVVTGEN